ncbi:hypothetical protein CRUP_029781, partial [Coryphaenoides rupestris]
MAYGQTGSGKIHTMMGSQWPSGSPQLEEEQGIILKAAVELFRRVKSAGGVMQLIRATEKLRARCPTLVHGHSSRSHLVVTLS